MKTTKRLLAVLMVLVLIAGCVPFAGAASTSGYTGDVRWYFDSSTGTLTISGYGSMADYCVETTSGSYGTYAPPWFSYSQSIKRIVVEKNVEHIGSGSFSYGSGIVSDCAVEQVEIKSYCSIGNHAFEGCRKLETVVYSSVGSIGAYAFAWCPMLKSITLSASEVGNYAFERSGLENIVFKRGQIDFGIGVFCGNKFKCLDYPYSFFPESIFEDCSYLESISLSSEIEGVRKNAFNNTPLKAIFPYRSQDDNTWNEIPIEYGNDAFKDAVVHYGLTNHLDENNDYVCDVCCLNLGARIASGTFDDNMSWELNNYGVLVIDGKGDMITDYSYDKRPPWQSYNDSIKKIMIGKKVSRIANNAFYMTKAQELQIISDDLTIGEWAFHYSNLTSIDFGKGIIMVGDYAFMDSQELVSVMIPSNVLSLGYQAFAFGEKLETVSVGSPIVGCFAFELCKKLKSINLEEGVKEIRNGAFRRAESLTEITLPKSLEKFERLVFNYNSYGSLKKATFLSNRTVIEDQAFLRPSSSFCIFAPACSTANVYATKEGFNFVATDTSEHQDSRNKTKEPTCIEDGEEELVCEICGFLETKSIPALGHTPQTYTTPSTCAENGFTITICTRCGETLSKEILPRLDHNWTSEVTQNPTCTAQGVMTYTCESCGETYTEPVDVLAHQWDDGKMTKEPSCTEAGEMTYTCATGGETRTEPIDKLDHEIVLVAGKAASCTEPGLTDGWQCKNCKKWFAEQQTIPALDHDPQIGKVVEPTCTDPGYTPFICTRCGETVSKTDPTDALGHDMQPTYVWAKDDSTVTATMVCTRCEAIGAAETAEVKTEITVKPTCSTEGELTLIAAFNNKSFYGQTKTKTLPRDPDAHVFKVTVTPPTCLDDGYTTHACTLCRYGYSDEIVPALGHDYQHHDAKAPTCEAPGWDAYDTCSRCDYTTYSELATVDHDDADNDGKCDMCGDQMRGGSHCKYCGKIHGGAFGWLTKLIHSILAVFKR